MHNINKIFFYVFIFCSIASLYTANMKKYLKFNIFNKQFVFFRYLAVTAYKMKCFTLSLFLYIKFAILNTG